MCISVHVHTIANCNTTLLHFGSIINKVLLLVGKFNIQLLFGKKVEIQAII